MNENAAPAKSPGRGSRTLRFGLSGKLLALTMLFIMISEVLIYVPSISNYRLGWLRDRLAAARTAALVLDAAPAGMVPESLARQILRSVGARAVAMRTGQSRRLLAMPEPLPAVTDNFDLREVSLIEGITDAFETMLCRDNDLMRVVGPAPMGNEFVEIVLDEAPLREAMLRYSTNILLLSMLILLVTAAVIYLALHYLFVRPLHRITANMTAFRQDPENPEHIVQASRRSDEIGIAERELAAMQSDLASMLQQKNRLAALGLAVSKINHDLRNLLASAQLFSDRLASLPDPTVQRFAPKLVHTLERAIAFCQSTLSFGQVKERPAERRMIQLEPLVEEVRETVGLSGVDKIRWISAVERGLMVDADSDQLFRVLVNLVRNAVQALEARAPNDPVRDQIRITGRREGAVTVIEVSDTGPGLSEKARAHLFEAFQGSTRPGGTGLGLVIAAELVRAQGGEIRLVDGTIGATFRITIPDRAVDFGARRARA
ncbi:MAG TPA: HAMP domain-containing sensor histidine kinase [Xanthobacteraceae bacterium]|nr:HAMP domain-containing sensor histidine kinase [Xanthobacteraceae bacterium]